MTDEELIEELCLTVSEIRNRFQKTIDYIIERRRVLIAKGEVIEDADYVARVLVSHSAGIACCNRWFKKNGVEE